MNGSLGRSFQSEVLVDGVALIHNLAAVPLRVSLHVSVEPLSRTGKVPVGLAPNLVSVKQRLRAGVDPLSMFTAFYKKSPAQVVVKLVLLDHLHHRGRHYQTEPHALDAPGAHPRDTALDSYLCL